MKMGAVECVCGGVGLELGGTVRSHDGRGGIGCVGVWTGKA